MKMKRSTLDSKTCIFQSHLEDRERQRCVFYLKKGVAKFYLSNHERKRTDLNDRKLQKVLNLTTIGKILGMYEFITGQDYSICCSSIDLCMLQSLSWNDFHEVISQLFIEVYSM